MKLSTRLALFFAVVVVAVLAVLSFMNHRTAAQFLLRNQNEELEFMSESLTRAAQAIVESSGERPAYAFLRAEDEARERLTIEFAGGAPMTKSPSKPHRLGSDDLLLTFESALRLPSGNSTTLRFVERSRGSVNFSETRLLEQLAVGFAFTLVASVGLRLLLERHLSRPLTSLAHVAEEAGRGVLNKRAERGNSEEIDKLALSLNRMLDSVVAARDAAARQDLERIRLLEVLRRGDRDRTVDYLASEFAHELGSPLNVIHGRASMLLEKAPAGSAEHDLGRQIFEQVERISTLIRRRVGRHRPIRVRQPVAEVVHQAEVLIDPILTDRGVELSFFSEPGIVAYFETERLLQVVTSLILTSVRTSQPRSRVEMSLTRIVANESVPPQVEPGRFALLRIKNPDPEPDPTLLGELGAPDEGLGLSYRLCEDIVQSLGGFIEFESAPGQGTTFSIYLPKTVATPIES